MQKLCLKCEMLSNVVLVSGQPYALLYTPVGLTFCILVVSYILKGAYNYLKIKQFCLLFQVAGAMGVMCIVSGLIYLADFFYVLCQRTALLQQY